MALLICPLSFNEIARLFSAAVFLASTATKVAIYAIARFLFSVFYSHPTMLEIVLVNVVMPLGILAMFVAGGIAFYQRDLKRMLAFSSVSQIELMNVPS